MAKWFCGSFHEGVVSAGLLLWRREFEYIKSPMANMTVGQRHDFKNNWSQGVLKN